MCIVAFGAVVFLNFIGRTVVYGSHYRQPNFHPKFLILAASAIIGYRRPAASHVDRPRVGLC